MLTTALNPTVWLLVATMTAALAGAVQGRTAREVVRTLERYLCAWPVLAALMLLAATGVGSRVVLGFLSPGAYAEEVAAAQTFVQQRELYAASDGKEQLREWIADTPAVPWGDVPGVTPCQVNAIANRASFYTEHAHTPMLLLAGVPIVQAAGGRGLYVVLAILSLGAVIAMAAVLIERAGVPWRSRQGLFILTALAGWQPVLAGLRQGDAVLPAAGLVTLTWHFARQQKGARSAAAAAAASCLSLSAAGVLPALVRWAPRAASLALVIVVSAASATIALAGAAVIPGYLQTIAETARTYAHALPNYGVLGRIMAAGDARIAAVCLTIAAGCSWWRARTMDATFGTFTALGLLAAPVVWSQHLALLIVPAAVLLLTIAASRSATALAGWSLLVLFFSLPDPAVARIAVFAGEVSSASPLPVVPFALVIFWFWTTFSSASRSAVAPAASVAASGSH